MCICVYVRVFLCAYVCVHFKYGDLVIVLQPCAVAKVVVVLVVEFEVINFGPGL